MAASKNKIFILKILKKKGIATVEMLFLLVVFVVLFSFTLGMWGAVHSGTLRSIAARHYAFTVINNRTHFVYHRDTDPPDYNTGYYKDMGYRFFASVEAQGIPHPHLKAEKKLLVFFTGIDVDPASGGGTVNPIRLKQGYGICLDYKCGNRPW